MKPCRAVSPSGVMDASTYSHVSEKKKMKKKSGRCSLGRVCFIAGLLLVACVTASFRLSLWPSGSSEEVQTNLEEFDLGLLISEENSEILEGISAANQHMRDVYNIQTTFCQDPKQCFTALRNQVKNGMRNFILDPEKFDIVVLCDYIRNLGFPLRILSLSDIPSGCEGLVVPIEDVFGPSMSVLNSRLMEMEVRSAYVVMEIEDKEKIRDNSLEEIFHNQSLAYINLVLTPDLKSEELKDLLTTVKEHPDSPILFTSGKSFFKIIQTESNISFLRDRAILANLNNLEKVKLIGDDRYRTIAEEIFLITTSHITESKYELMILKNANLYPSYSNILGVKSLMSLHKLIMSSPVDVKLAQESKIKNLYKIARLRLIPNKFLGDMFIQLDPWLRESVVEVKSTYSSEEFLTRWELSEKHSPFKIFTKNQILQFSKDEGCNLSQVEVLAEDPAWNIPIYSSWNVSILPPVLMIPNSSPRGFTMNLFCNNNNLTSSLEVACLGGYQIENPVECLVTKILLRSRRQTRSYQSYNSISIDDDTRNTVKEEKKEQFTDILPQVGGCIGSTGGCGFCFIFLFYIPVQVGPGVCYGACGVAVGGSCTSLIKIGVQLYHEYTVICSELFHQEYITSQSYLADARYGARLSTSIPLALIGYQTAASPIVKLMKKFPLVTEAVYGAALPWIEHMEYKEGIRDENNMVGQIMTVVGIPVFFLLGIIITYLPLLIFAIYFILKRYKQK